MLVGLQFIEGYIVESVSEFEPLAEYIDMVPVKEARKERKSGGSASTTKGARSHRDELLQQFPWLERFWKVDKPAGLGFEEEESSAAPAPSKRRAVVDEGKEDLADEEIDVILDELHRYRSELAADRSAAESVVDCITTALGGAWTLEHKWGGCRCRQRVCS